MGRGTWASVSRASQALTRVLAGLLLCMPLCSRRSLPAPFAVRAYIPTHDCDLFTATSTRPEPMLAILGPSATQSTQALARRKGREAIKRG